MTTWLGLVLGAFAYECLYLSLTKSAFEKRSSWISVALAIIVLIFLAITGAAGIAIKQPLSIISERCFMLVFKRIIYLM